MPVHCYLLQRLQFIRIVDSKNKDTSQPALKPGMFDCGQLTAEGARALLFPGGGVHSEDPVQRTVANKTGNYKDNSEHKQNDPDHAGYCARKVQIKKHCGGYDPDDPVGVSHVLQHFGIVLIIGWPEQRQ